MLSTQCAGAYVSRINFLTVSCVDRMYLHTRGVKCKTLNLCRNQRQNAHMQHDFDLFIYWLCFGALRIHATF